MCIMASISVNFYTFSFKNPDREKNLRKRFSEEFIDIEFIEPVEKTDNRVAEAPDINKRTWAIMFNHLDMLQKFLESSAEFGIFCEDDIQIRRGLKEFLPEIVASYKRLKLEILMLGYLLPYKPIDIKTTGLTIIGQPLSYFSYEDDIWGSQMYMLDRKTANRMLEFYTLEYALKSLTDNTMTPFSPDWTLTKKGIRAAIYPMMAVEEGKVVTTHQGQIDFHRRCFEAQFDTKFYH